MEYLNLGTSGLKISKLVYGSWRTTVGENAEKRSIECHNKALELGINFFDTANVYNAGQAEEVVGKFMAEHKRSEIVVATKCRGNMGGSPTESGLSKKHIIEACEASLNRLQADHIDLYQAHSEDESVPLRETLSAFNQLIRQGKILHWGVSNWSGTTMAEAKDICHQEGWEFLISNQPKYNMFFTHPVETNVQPFCKKNNIGMIVYSPLNQGILTDKYRENIIPENSRAFSDNPKLKDDISQEYNQYALKELYLLADKLQRPLSHIALQWLFSKDAVAAPIIGATSPEQLTENVNALEKDLDENTLKEIDKILAIRKSIIMEEDAKRLRKENE
ncbi:MAG: aldo/keto reductase [Planctomycetota bacterium]|nr:MAG: aldo/keto reductase [Planctomycetota bacterium]